MKTLSVKKGINKTKIQSICEELRERYDLINFPIDVEMLIERLGLYIVPKRHIFEKNSWDAFLSLDLESIIVDYDIYLDETGRFSNRLRFTLAHEIGHFMLHRDLIKEQQKRMHQCMSEKPNQYSRDKIYSVIYEFDDYHKIEWQANEFAGNLLVPSDKLAEKMETVKHMIKELGFDLFLQNDPKYLLEYIEKELSKFFGVSKEVIFIRLKNEKLWPIKDEY